MAKLVVTLVALWILAPAIALAGGSFDPQEQRAMPQSKIVIENHVPADDGSGVIVAAVIAGAFGLAGTIYVAKRKS